MKKYTTTFLVIGCVALLFAWYIRASKPAGDNIILTPERPYQNTLGGYDMGVTVNNQSGQLISAIILRATFKDEQGKPVGTDLGTFNNIPTGETRYVVIHGIDVQNAASGEVTIQEVFN